MKNNKIKLNSGFTIIELVAVIAVLGILVAIAIFVFFDIANSSKETVDIANLKMLNQATDFYRTQEESDPFITSSDNDYLIELLVPNYITETPIPQQDGMVYSWVIADAKWQLTEEGGGFSPEGSFSTQESSPGKIISYDGGAGTDLVIPYEINGVLVTEIGHAAFDNNGNEEENLTSVILPEGLLKLGALAFRGNDLSSITIPGSLSTVGILAFSENNLTEVNISEGVTKIGEWAFAKNSISSIEIPNSIAQIDAFAFAYNDITEITIGSNVSLNTNTFYRSNATGFNEFYDSNNNEAGTYVYINGSWVKQ